MLSNDKVGTPTETRPEITISLTGMCCHWFITDYEVSNIANHEQRL